MIATGSETGGEGARAMPTETPKRANVGFFATCLVDLFRPSVGFQAARLIESAGYRVVVPRAQTCCGQPAYNSGDRAGARRVARRMVALFDGFDHVVAPSGSCAAMFVRHFPDLLSDDAQWAGRARALAGRTHELVDFLSRVAGWRPSGPRPAAGSITYHDSCSGLRELGIREQPRALLAAAGGPELREMEGSDICCGFGGTFCVKYPAISEAMADKKIDSIEATGAGTVVGGDLGCLMHIEGRLSRRGSAVATRHVAEILAAGADDQGGGG